MKPTALTTSDRFALRDMIMTSLKSLKGVDDERRHLMDTLGFVGERLKEAQAAAERRALQGQLDILANEVSELKAKLSG